MNSNAARVIFKCRSKTLNIKEHIKYKVTNTSCRWCGVGEETLNHVVNCGKSTLITNVDEILCEMKLHKLKEIATRVEDFLSKVDV